MPAQRSLRSAARTAGLCLEKSYMKDALHLDVMDLVTGKFCS